MTIKETIGLHLSPPHVLEGKWRYSAFIAALRDARLATGRNPNTGDKINTLLLGSWLGTMGYLALLDQIGKCFKPKGMATLSTRREIIKALTYFSNLNERKKYAIYALRCSFAHDFSLFNIPQRERDKALLQHHFVVGVGKDAPLITFPDQGNDWNGVYQDKSSENRTSVNLEKLGDLVEDICQKIREYADSDELEITLNGGADELACRYFISTPQR